MTAPRSATHLAWDAAGRPDSGRPTTASPDAYCLVCGTPAEQSASAKDALGANFDLLTATRPDSTRVCPACAWALAGKPPATLRMWSIVTTGGTPLPPSPATAPASGSSLHLCNRRDMSAVVTALTSPPADDAWAVAVAVSGQKHLLPYTPVNHGGGPWLARFEAATVRCDPALFAGLVGAAADLRRTGHHPDRIREADPSIPALTGDGLTAWRRHAPLIRPHAGSQILDLALYLTTKETLDDLADRFAGPHR